MKFSLSGDVKIYLNFPTILADILSKKNWGTFLIISLDSPRIRVFMGRLFMRTSCSFISASPRRFPDRCLSLGTVSPFRVEELIRFKRVNCISSGVYMSPMFTPWGFELESEPPFTCSDARLSYSGSPPMSEPLWLVKSYPWNPRVGVGGGEFRCE